MVSVAVFQGGDNLDEIPESVTIGGTFRAFSSSTLQHVRKRIEEVCGITMVAGFRTILSKDKHSVLITNQQYFKGGGVQLFTDPH